MSERIQIGEIDIAVTRKDIKHVHSWSCTKWRT